MSKMPDGRPVEYLGDGVYCIYEPSGVWLHANHHLNPTHRIWLENYTIKSLFDFIDYCEGDISKLDPEILADLRKNFQIIDRIENFMNVTFT